MNEVLRRHPAYRELKQLVCELSLISHTSGRSYEGRTRPASDEDIGGRRPPGGDREFPNRRDVNEWTAFMASYHRRTVGYFLLEVERCETVARLQELVGEARETLDAWRRAPLPSGNEPEYGSPQWKRYIAESREDAGVLAGRFFVTRRYINMVRRDYGAAA